jgi:mannose-6-phosphate isomerase
VIHVPAGTVHAVGRGVRFFEVQQSSGLTYRLWDWGRRGRERHLEKAMSVLNFSAGAVRRHAADRITDPTGHYDAEIFSITNEHSLPAIAPFSVITVLEGEVGFNPGPACVREGWSVFVPEGVALTLSSSNARAVRSWTTTPRPSSA